MLVKKNDCIAIPEDDILTPYEVILADDEYFAAAPIYLGDDDQALTNLDYPMIHCNDETKTSLKELGYIKLD